ncbi:MAG: Ig-like domain-containing protein, partial [Treponemataceae bacterium]|nr:Ig-like domain-containing protein [Treponemataceae bacterium]
NNGTWRFNITASDKAGNSTSTTVEFVVDVSAPVISEITSVPEQSKDTVLPFDFRGTANDVGDSGLAKIEYSLTGAEDSWKEATTGKNWIALVTEEELTKEGAGTIYVRATDAAGNTGAVESKAFYFDRSKPTVSVTGESTRQASALFTLEGTAADTNALEKVEITQDKGGTKLTKTMSVSGKNESWTGTFPLSADDTAYTADSVGNHNADGEYTYTVVATDKAGKTSAVSTVTVTIDTTAPSSVAITAPTAADTGNNALNGTSYKFSGTVADNVGGVGIAKVEYALLSAALPENGAPSDGAIQEATLASSGTAWSFNKDLATGTAAEGSDALSEGTYYLYVRATDAAGNKSGWSAARVFDVDQSAPALALASGLTAGTNYFGGADSTSITISGTAGDSYKLDSTAAVTLKAGDTVLKIPADSVDADGNWRATISSADITANTLVTITATAKDAVGKTSASSCNVYYDSEAPALTVTSPAEGTITTTGKFTIKGSIMDSGAGIDTASAEKPTITYTVKNTKNNTGSNIIFADKVSLVAEDYNGASWTKDITLDAGSQEGTLELSFTVQDKIGNTSTTEPITFYFDKSSPTLTETLVGNDVKYTNKSVSMKGTAEDTNMLESVKLSVAGGTLASPYVLTAYTNGSETETTDDDTIKTSVDWTSEIVAGTAMPGEGTYSVTVTATDTAGNTRSVERSIVYDLTAPVFKTEDDKKPRVTTVAADATNGWYGTGELDFEGILTDNYELDKVEYSLDGGNTWTRFDTATTAVEKEVEFSKKLVFTNSGTYTVKIKATDRAGNVGTTEVTGIQIDLTVPGVSITSPESGKTVNGESGVNVTVSAKDVHSGLSGIKVQLNNSDFSANDKLITAATDGENGEKTYTAKIDKSEITAAGTIYVQAIDNVGKTTVTSVPFGFDNVPPTVSITSPAAGTELNKEIDIIGRAGDTALKNVTVYCQNVATAEDFAADNAEAWSSIGSFDGTEGYNWNVHLDTATAYTDGTFLYVKAVAEDEAGNTTETDVYKYTINQDADRPIITLTNVSIWGTDKGFMSKDNVSGIKDQSTLIGTVNDDDGIAEMKVYNEAGEDISENVQFKYKNYNWTLKLNGDGYQEIEFVVKDTAGTTFKTGVYETYSLNSITLKDNDGNAIGTKTGYAGGAKKETNKTPYDTRLYLTVDNNAPTVLKTEFRLTDEDEWVSGLGAITVGGENKNLQVRQYVFDENSVQGVTVSIDKNTGDTATEADYYEKSAVARGTIEEGGKTYTGYEATLNVEQLASRSLQIKISASDMSGHANNNTYAVTLDNTPPSLEV